MGNETSGGHFSPTNTVSTLDMQVHVVL